MPFAPGVSGNPNGRLPGTRIRRTQEIIDLIKARGDKDPLVALSEIISTSDNPDHRISASNILAPYLHSKRGTIPSLRYVEEPLQLPHPSPTSLAHFRDNIVYLSDMKAQGRLDLDTADSLINDQQWRAKILGEELALAAKGEGQRDTTIKIEGILPQLPGTQIAMEPDGVRYAKEPQLNHHNGHVIEHQNVAPVLPRAPDTPANPLESLENTSDDTL